jgi:hypothetical protein
VGANGAAILVERPAVNAMVAAIVDSIVMRNDMMAPLSSGSRDLLQLSEAYGMYDRVTVR